MKTYKFLIVVSVLLLSVTGVFAQIKVISNGNVIIGSSTSSTYKLRVNGDILADGNWLKTSGAYGILFQSYGGGLYMTESNWIKTYGSKSFYHNTGIMRTDGEFHVGSSGSTFLINSSGYVGIGDITPSQRLEVEGSVRATSFIATSDERFKENIVDLASDKDIFLQLRPVKYKVKVPELDMDSLIKIDKEIGIKVNTDSIQKELSETDSPVIEAIESEKDKKVKEIEKDFYDRSHIGFVAQDIQKLYPELVYEDADGYLGIDYTALIPILVGVLKEQQEELGALNTRISQLESKKTK